MIFPKTNSATPRGFTLIEVYVAVGISILLGAAILDGLLQCMSYTASSRLMTNARAIVHRNVDAAAGVSFPSASSAPSLLMATAGSWSVCEDDGGAVPGITAENIQISGSNNSVVVTGTLSRMVTQENVPESSSAQVYRVTFKVDYAFLSKNYSYSETTLRAVDQNN